MSFLARLAARSRFPGVGTSVAMPKGMVARRPLPLLRQPEDEQPEEETAAPMRRNAVRREEQPQEEEEEEEMQRAPADEEPREDEEVAPLRRSARFVRRAEQQQEEEDVAPVLRQRPLDPEVGRGDDAGDLDPIAGGHDHRRAANVCDCRTKR